MPTALKIHLHYFAVGLVSLGPNTSGSLVYTAACLLLFYSLSGHSSIRRSDQSKMTSTTSSSHLTSAPLSRGRSKVVSLIADVSNSSLTTVLQIVGMYELGGCSLCYSVFLIIVIHVILGVASAIVAIFGIIATGASRSSLYDLRIIPGNYTRTHNETVVDHSLFFHINTQASLANHWGISFLVVFFGTAIFYILMRVAFKHVPGAPSRLRIMTASCVMGLLFITIYTCQTYLYVSAGTFYYDCFDSTSATLGYVIQCSFYYLHLYLYEFQYFS